MRPPDFPAGRPAVLTLARLRRLARPPRGFRLRCAAVLLTAATMLGAAEAGLRRWDPAFGRSETFQSLARRALSPETRVLVVGTSHVYTAVRPSRLSVPAVNLAISGLGYGLAEPLLRAGLRRAPGVQLVLLEVDGFPLHADRAADRGGDVRELRRYGVRVSAAVDDPAAAARLPAVWHRPAWTPSRLVHLMVEERARISEPGFHGWSVGLTTFKPGARARYHDSLAVGDAAEGGSGLLRLVTSLRSAGIAVALIRTPHHAGYRDYAPPRFGSALDDAVAGVRARFPGVPFWDGYADPRFTAADYFDEDHLNVRGADRYTALLDRRIRARLNLPPMVR